VWNRPRSRECVARLEADPFFIYEQRQDALEDVYQLVLRMDVEGGHLALPPRSFHNGKASAALSA
jgi:hypothetical protein